MSRSAIRFGLTLGLLTSYVLSVHAADPRGYLDQTRRLQQIQAQKLLYDVRGVLLQADRLADKEPDRAADMLKRAITALESDTVLPKSKRDSMISMLSTRMKSIRSGGDAQALDEKAAQAAIRGGAETKKDDESAKLQKDLGELLELQKKGRSDEAKKMAAELAKKYPGNAAVTNAYYTSSALTQLASARQIRNDKERGFDNAIRDVERSAVVPKGDIQFPSAEKWKRINERAKKYGRPRYTPQEQAIIRALNAPISVSFKNARFQDVIEYLATKMGQPILLDQAALREAQIDYETPVSIAVRGVTARTVLRKILGDHSLAYIVKDQAIQVTTVQKARESMTVRSYPVADLLAIGGGPGDPATNFFGPALGPVQRMQSVAALIGMIQTSVDPGSWQANGGQGAIYFHYPTMSLVVKQSAEVHASMGGAFGR